jgi:cytochrome c oxidase subunit I+III
VSANPSGRSLHERFESVWGPWPGLVGATATVNHTSIGRRFIVTALIFFAIAGVMAMLLRTQLAVPDNDFLDHDTYNALFTMHGTMMMFLFAVPIGEGLAIYLIPKMIGARDQVFPRLGAFAYWCYLFGALLLLSSFLFSLAPDGGWFMYPPLVSAEISPERNTDFWLLGVTFVEISAIATAVEVIVTVLQTRAPGMAINRMPLFAWYILIMAFMIIFGFPPLIAGSILLELERAFDLPFFIAERGGDPILWQHLFWLFGHPEVYIILLPALAVISTVLPVFSGRPIVGYNWIVIGILALGFLSFGLWVHHMYAVGIPHTALGFFSAATLAVAIPTGIQIFAWIATLMLGRPRLSVPMLFILGFFFIFTIGGLTGVMLGIVPFDWQVHDTHFVVAHFHYVLVGGTVFPIFAGIYYWLPHFSGRMPSPTLGKTVFWLFFIGFNLTFLVMHVTGFLGMPRRVYTYAAELGWHWTNLLSTLGAFVMTAGVALFALDLLLHFRHGRRAPPNPWESDGLEWAMRLPPGNYNFISQPFVTDRNPLWQEPDLGERIERGDFYLADPSAGRRETMGTDVYTGAPTQVIQLAQNSWLPLATALCVAVFFVGFLLREYWLAGIGAVLTAVAALIWAWHNQDRRVPDELDAGLGLRLPVHYASRSAPGILGLGITLLADATLFASLLFGLFFLLTVAPGVPMELPEPACADAGLWALLLLPASSLAMVWAVRAAAAAATVRLRFALAAAVLLALTFVALVWVILRGFAPEPQSHGYWAMVYVLAFYVFIHQAIAIMAAAFASVRAAFGFVTPRRLLDLRAAALLWHYTSTAGVLAFGAIFLAHRAMAAVAG